MKRLTPFCLAFVAVLFAVQAPAEKQKRAGEDWWSLQPVQAPPPPAADHPIDGFIREGLKAKGLALSAPADKRDLLRRLYFDLTGLPPSPAEMEAFLKDPDPKA